MLSKERTESGAPFLWQVFAPGCDQKKCDEISETFDTTSDNAIDFINQFDEKSCCRWIPNKLQDFKCEASFLGDLYKDASFDKDRVGGWPCVRLMKRLNQIKNRQMETTDYWNAGQMQMSPDFGLIKEFDVDMTGQVDGESKISWEPIDTNKCFNCKAFKI